MRIVFKLWTKGKQNSIKMPTKSLQNLWRCSELEMREILDELIFNEICEISEQDGFLEFTCRRFVKENKLSEIRSKASKGESKQKQKANKTQSKGGQITENDYDYESDNDIVIEEKGGVGEKAKFTPPKFDELKNYFFEKTQDLNRSAREAERFIDHYTNKDWKIGSSKTKMKDWRAAVRNWLKNDFGKNGSTTKNYSSQTTTKQAPVGVKATGF